MKDFKHVYFPPLKMFYIGWWEAYNYHKPNELFIKTLEGDHHVSVDDYIIQGVKGELYTCKPDVFGRTYEETDESLPEYAGGVK